ncbi:glutamyl-tRNA synthetase [Cylindrobasidium torrendii FP15055 ss-10]|uniref:Glutamate--tRNA ligase, mitochondrial n=1 Tax=Cylindrobasidium torrendii FP15055 ss-10 TaxID=1314674 RepID=A0A0D7BSI8_9AGAR|nr:glutamyl-tRNA synthetase [Cylindrobasidium torrendii FP15055 ss-10]
MVLLRFAPSPTGPLHLGGLRMALYNHLFARKHGGKWILRIEDTDATRYVPGSVEGIRKGLEWAGLQYDFGPERDLSKGPYYQTERLDLYRTYARQLLDDGLAYRCFCSTDKLADTRERLARSGSSLSYDKTCTHISEEESNRKARAGEKFTIRLDDSQRPARPEAQDMVFRHLKDAHASLSTDPVLLKSDSYPTYHLASVVDDHTMGITHVLRGEEWLTSLPLHLDIYAHLKLKPPTFAHIPLLLNSDGTKMSKRHGDVQVIDYIRRGWEPAAVLNWLALAGWGAKFSESTSDGLEVRTKDQEAPDSTALMTLDDMIQNFDLSMLTQRSSGLDPSKLEYLNKHHIGRMRETEPGLQKLAEGIHQFVKEAFPHSEYTSIPVIKRVIQILESRLTNMHDIPAYVPYIFIDPDLSSAEAGKLLASVPEDTRKVVLDDLVRIVDTQAWDPARIFEAFKGVQESHGLKRGQLLKTLRGYLTGRKDGPPLVDILELLGPDRVKARLVVL